MNGHYAKIAKEGFTKEEAAQVATSIGIDWNSAKFDLEEFRRGMDVELEHGRVDSRTDVTNDDPNVTGKIAWAHLLERPDYYKLLDANVENAPKSDEESVKVSIQSSTYPELIEVDGQVYRIAKKWKKLPKGWTKKSVEEFFDSVGGSVSKCITKFEGTDIDDPGAFCASLKDKVKGPKWRKEDRKKKKKSKPKSKGKGKKKSKKKASVHPERINIGGYIYRLAEDQEDVYEVSISSHRGTEEDVEMGGLEPTDQYDQYTASSLEDLLRYEIPRSANWMHWDPHTGYDGGIGFTAPREAEDPTSEVVTEYHAYIRRLDGVPISDAEMELIASELGLKGPLPQRASFGSRRAFGEDEPERQVAMQLPKPDKDLVLKLVELYGRDQNDPLRQFYFLLQDLGAHTITESQVDAFYSALENFVDPANVEDVSDQDELELAKWWMKKIRPWLEGEEAD